MNQDEQLAIQEFYADVDWSVFGDLEEPRPDYNNSCPFNIHLCSSDESFSEVVQSLCAEIGYEPDRALEHMSMVVLNLYKTHMLDPDRWLGYSRDASKYKLIFRYNRQRITYRPLMKVIKGLIAKEYVKPLSFTFNIATGSGKCSRIRASDKLIELLHRHEFTENKIQVHADEEVIILKDDDKKVKDYDDNEEVDAMRVQVGRYNDFLEKTYIDLHHDGFVPKRTLYIDLTSKRVRRIFSKGSFERNGRFYRGWWMGLPEELRHRIIINNQKVVECDYSSMSIHILYAMEGINYGLKGKDAYTLPDYDDDKKTRNLLKKLLLSVLNARTVRRAFISLKYEIEDNPLDYPADIPPLKQVLSDFTDYHAPIAKYLDPETKDVGLQTMYHDSQIAERVISTLIDKNIPVLSVHDSFICPTLNYNDLYDAMVSAYRYFYNEQLKYIPDIRAIIKIKYTELTYEIEYPYDGEYSEYYYDIATIQDMELVKRLMEYDDTGNIPVLSQVKLIGTIG